MDAVLTAPVEIVHEVRDKVNGLELALTRLTVQHEGVLSLVREIREELRSQQDISESYREKLLTRLTATEKELENVKREIELQRERGLVNWIRKNAPVMTVALAVLTLIWAIGRYLATHLHF